MHIMEKNLLQAISDLHLRQAEVYVTKSEMKDYKADHDCNFKEFKDNIKWVIGKAVALSSLAVTIIVFVANWLRGGST